MDKILGRLTLVVFAAGFAPSGVADSDPVPQAPCLQWTVVLDAPVGTHPVSGPDGRLWVVGRDGGLYTLPPHDGRSPTSRESWTRLAMPSGAVGHHIALDRSGAPYMGGSSWGVPAVFHRAGRSGAAPFEDLKPPFFGAWARDWIDDDGVVWAAGEWGQIGRYEDRRWKKEVLPLPYHVWDLRMAAGGRGWAFGETRNQIALYYRDSREWLVAARPPGLMNTTHILYVDSGVCILQTEKGIETYPAPGLGPGTLLLAKGPGTLNAATFTDRDHGWAVVKGRLQRFERGTWTPVRDSPVEDVGEIVDLSPFGIYAILSGGRLARLTPAPECRSTEELPPTLERMSLWPPLQRNQGAAIVRIRGREQLYIVDHDRENPTIRLRTDDQGMVADEDRLDYSKRLGNEGPVRTPDWSTVYDMTALSADLDGDGREEIVLITMYDVDRVYRNVRDDHFVDWTEESGIGGAGLDDSIGGCLLDADHDGGLDLYVSKALVPDRLFLNNGAASFRDATHEAGLATSGLSGMVSCADLDGDGDTDILVATSGKGLLIHENRTERPGHPRFVTHRLLSDTSSPSAASAININSVAVADLDGDALPELFLAVEGGCDLFLSNKGGLRFEQDPLFLPADQPCASTRGANFFDFDNDGDLDLALTGSGPGRFYTNEGGRLVWHRRSTDPGSSLMDGSLGTGSALFDLDEDGDLDLFQSALVGPSYILRNTTNDSRYLTVMIEGPPANRSAVGAQVFLYERGREGDRRKLVGWRQVAGGSGYGSMDSKLVAFGGVDPRTQYDLVVRMSGARDAVLEGLRPPRRCVVRLDTGPFGSLLEEAAFRTGHFFHDPWHRRGTQLTLALLAGLAALAFLLSRSWRLSFFEGLALGGQPLFCLGFFVALPLDPGSRAVLQAAVLGSLLSLVLFAVAHARRRAMVGPHVPELWVELDFKLRAFHHDQVPQRALDRIQFLLRSLRSDANSIGEKQSALLREDLLALDEVVVPRWHAILKLAESVGLPLEPGADALARVEETASALSQVSTRPVAATKFTTTIAELTNALDRMESWCRDTRRQIDRPLTLDLSTELRRYAAQRRRNVRCRTEIVGRQQGLFVRFLADDLNTVLDTLTDNAERALERTPDPLIRITLEERIGASVIMLFEDNGPGIPAQERTTIFSEGVSSRGSGHGFGLYNARRIVERYGGTITADASEEGGARFVLHFASPAPGSTGEATSGPGEVLS
jgi:signal transduction histidine kinase